MITIAMSAVINAEPEQVWRALTDPDALMEWDERVIGSIDVPDDYPVTGQHARWRYRVGSVPLVLHDRPQEIVQFERLRSAVTVGPMHFQQTYTLCLESCEPHRTRLGMKLVQSNSVHVMGGVVDRFEVRRMAVDRIDTTLRSIQKWCENPH